VTLQPLTSEAIPNGMRTPAPEIAQIPEIDYPDSDGNPMSDNTEQYRWIVTIKENLEIMFADDPNIFVAGDLLWYPVRHSQKRTAPDVMVAISRPKGRRGSYKQWEEDNIAPQVAFEILSPSNKDRRGNDALEEKFEFYQQYGVQEYYIYDPDDRILTGWQSVKGKFWPIENLNEWISPLLQIRFEWLIGKELVLYRPNGQRFLSSVELDQRANAAEQRAGMAEQFAEQERQLAEQERERANAAEQFAEQERQLAERERERANAAEQFAEQERQLAERERQLAEQERQRANRLADRLLALGIDPEL
jgi:Uma2 family endonuclease